MGHDPPRWPNADWRVLTTANAAGTNGLTCLPKHGVVRDNNFLVTHPVTDPCERCLTTTIAGHGAYPQRHRVFITPTIKCAPLSSISKQYFKILY
ncbi:unnamed protein product [Diatraea saccharalis]|uniref:Uncharacterized protein n=1 Tax=Diatraea saccharalis TaxID=40085 RepID=A0A9N9WHM9_9NEOP|nr:unnamed protein product [Diatraea saccharalis]